MPVVWGNQTKDPVPLLLWITIYGTVEISCLEDIIYSLLFIQKQYSVLTVRGYHPVFNI